MSHSMVRSGMNKPCLISIWFTFFSSPFELPPKGEAQKRHWYPRLPPSDIALTLVCFSFIRRSFGVVSICAS